jgi:hypothetical protein
MNRIVKWSVLGLGLLSASSAAAQSDEGFEIGFRTGYGIALGKADGGTSLGDYVSGQIPLWLDLGYRATPNIMIGLYGAYGFAFAGGAFKDGCDSGAGVAGVVAAKADCSAHDLRFGGQVQYHFTPDRSLDPWIGAGFGYEWLTNSVSASAGNADVEISNTRHGFEFLTLQGGLDFKPDEETNAGIGPYISFSLGEYSKTSIDCSGSICRTIGVRGTSGDIDDTAVHEWFTVGVRGTYVP